jgi:DNA-binding LacI/PurR family transcriptional regulator
VDEKSSRSASGRVTLEHVARRAEVSRALVSLVMRDEPGASVATRERVWAAARELGYRPDVRARALAGQKSKLIGVMFGVGVGSFHFDLLEGLYAAVGEHGHSLVLSALTRGRDERQAAESLHEFRIDALIMLGPPSETPLLAGQIPLVVVGWHVEHPDVDVVRTSDEQGMLQAVSYLSGLGHRQIAHVDGGDGVIAASRRAGYVKAMTANGLGSEIRVVPGGQTQLDGQRAARSLLRDGELPTALVTYNDDTAAAVMNLLAQEGIKVPEQISVIGWDDQEAAALSPIPLTTVAQEPAEMAHLAVRRVADRLEHRRVPNREIVIEPHLHVRSSSAPPAH